MREQAGHENPLTGAVARYVGLAGRKTESQAVRACSDRTPCAHLSMQVLGARRVVLGLCCQRAGQLAHAWGKGQSAVAGQIHEVREALGAAVYRPRAGTRSVSQRHQVWPRGMCTAQTRRRAGAPLTVELLPLAQDLCDVPSHDGVHLAARRAQLWTYESQAGAAQCSGPSFPPMPAARNPCMLASAEVAAAAAAPSPHLCQVVVDLCKVARAAGVLEQLLGLLDERVWKGGVVRECGGGG